MFAPSPFARNRAPRISEISIIRNLRMMMSKSASISPDFDPSPAQKAGRGRNRKCRFLRDPVSATSANGSQCRLLEKGPTMPPLTLSGLPRRFDVPHTLPLHLNRVPCSKKWVQYSKKGLSKKGKRSPRRETGEPSSSVGRGRLRASLGALCKPASTLYGLLFKRGSSLSVIFTGAETPPPYHGDAYPRLGSSKKHRFPYYGQVAKLLGHRTWHTVGLQMRTPEPMSVQHCPSDGPSDDGNDPFSTA